MANWQGPSHSKEVRAADLAGTGPRRAYLMQRVDGTWTFGVGDPSEADAVLVRDPVTGLTHVDSDFDAANQRTPLLIGASTVIA